MEKANKLPTEELSKISLWISSFGTLKMTINQLLPIGPAMATTIQMQLNNSINAWCPEIINRLG